MKRTLVTVLVIALVVLSGCLEMIYRKPLSEAVAEEMASEGLADLAAIFQDGVRRNGIQSLYITVQDPDGMEGHMELSITWGLDDHQMEHTYVQVDKQSFIDKVTQEIQAEAAAAADGANSSQGGNGSTDVEAPDLELFFEDMPDPIESDEAIYCTPTMVIEVNDGQTTTTRRDGPCGDDDGSPKTDPFEGLEITSVDTDRWEVDAVVVNEDGKEGTLHIDQQGRVTEAAFTDADGADVEITLTYDALDAISLPEAKNRVSVSVEGDYVEVDPDSYSGRMYTVTEVDVSVPLSQLELRVQEGFNASRPPVATWGVDETVQSKQANLSFAFSDLDEDGALSIGDKFSITADEGVVFLVYDVYFHDTWADQEARGLGFFPAQ